MRNLLFRRAGLDELEEKWQSLVQQAYHPAYNGMGESYSGITTAEEKIENMKHYTAGIPIWTAWEMDHLAGILTGKISGDRLVLYDLFIAPVFQRQGIGRKLLQMAIEESGVREVTAEVNRENAASQALFKSLSFECKLTSDWLVLKLP